MPVIGPGRDDPEYDNYGPTWKTQDTPFRRWLVGKLTAAGFQYARDMAISCAPANRYHGLSDLEMGTIAILTGTGIDEVRAAHKADIAAWMREQEVRDHPDLADLDADLNRIAERH
ncbi:MULTISPECIES: hypothetical protein [unclassified Streptomyces]|uniref:hypothetical protein n=1 Tax=unclassified Streptomyces TaxID=2593676 RepID=UPI002DDC33D1|nr:MULTISPECIES: hypothetical protein [unclassified Streptomyces]WSA90116.1 hypothetical protein OIE63_00150 [Streptomyces sp. NBC_01795]WSS17272.1 hypothetical protein OG533_39245 [Streptomyces sp. NBC_01186]WSS46013.1 hypothetical protein OG220_39495 [Streptomyces sp. NBC_01187]